MLLDFMGLDQIGLSQYYQILHLIEKRRFKYIMKINPMVIVNILQNIYPIMRPILLKAVNNPDQTWDDYLMELCDKIFDYKG